MDTEDWPSRFPSADVVLVVPPFAPTFQPSLACHILQACARERGLDVTVVYANLLFASIVGHGEYEQLLDRRVYLEHIFRHAAFGLPGEPDPAVAADSALLDGLRAAGPWLARVGEIIRSIHPVVVGATCSFEQITSTVALLNRCKAIDPHLVTIVGGANCEGDMAEGLLSLKARIDYVASGESEVTFPRFLQRIASDGRYPERILQGSPCLTLDSLPRPVYHEYFDQYDLYLGDQAPPSTTRAVPYESSRGCWWGEKHHCTFCGLNGMSMGFRQKTPDRVTDDLKSALAAYPVTRVNFVDNIMPSKYFSTLLPMLADELPPSTTLFYEQKANITFEKAAALKAARVTVIQPGIEALNSHILRCMDKGVKAYQNLALLRYARSLGIRVTWNLLAGFPGDRPEDYEQTAQLMPHIPHLEPPDGLGFVRFDRFSPYFDHPQRYGIRHLRPKRVYFEIFPPWTEHEKLAYYFDGEYESGAFECPSVIERLKQDTLEWRERWTLNPKPMLAVVHLAGDQYVVVDTRDRSTPPSFDLVDEATAAVLLHGAQPDDRDEHLWAIERGLLIELDDRLVPLATARPAVMTELSAATRASGVRASGVVQHAA